MQTACLYIFSGLPGVGKTTLASMLASRKQAAYLRLDTIEQGLRDVRGVAVVDEGYLLGYRLAAENLRLAVSVVVDSCNPLSCTRRAWEQVATGAGARYVNIEICCSSLETHRKRVQERQADIAGFVLPRWEDVLTREYEEWPVPPVTIDTAEQSVLESFLELLEKLAVCESPSIS